ncbi:TIGR03854 family LLM class F420-dependent oxidoreductase [Kutzneria sp. CA-103260]|uniref:TIGR03854 family LLM class F420-dependent oxidoreductase n=1 Tax=Kutzneria sp. CA-103260 TaxID=2802641 RepID=UPI001BEE84E8|nr:coenzyme F420-dependent N5,N10-methenyltetrahydromethanopterin reductase [Kutzneria sp. CA-103260]
MGVLKVRLGVGLGPGMGVAGFPDMVDELEAAGVDSLWLSEIVYGTQVEPMIGMAHALARTEKLKVGTGVAVLPGRNPVLVAKQLATLAGLAPKRVLPVFGLRPARRDEWNLFPVPAGRRAAVFDESLLLLRRLLTEDNVSFEGEFFQLDGVSLPDRPARPLDIWVGGSAPAALRRVGRLADGWLGSFVTPEQAKLHVETIKAAAAEAGREVEEDHYGLSLAVAPNGLPPELARAATERAPGVDLDDLVPTSWDHARRLIDRYLDAGLTKFVLRQAGPLPWSEFLAEFLPLAQALHN